MSAISDKVRKMFGKNDDLRDAGLTTPDNIERFDHISYGTDLQWHFLDVYRPEEKHGEKLPVLLNCHGGGWVYGDKDRYQYYCMSLAQHGFAVVNFSYRLAPEFKFPAPIEDMNQVVHWILNHADQYDFDLENVFAVGDSAGVNLLDAYIMICINSEYAKKFTISTPPGFLFRAVLLNCGAYTVVVNDNPNDLTTSLMQDYLPEGGSKEELDMLNALPYMTKDFPPAFVVTANQDFLQEEAPIMLRRLEACGVPHEFRKYGTEEHPMQHVFQCNIKLEEAQKCTQEECDFLKKYFGISERSKMKIRTIITQDAEVDDQNSLRHFLFYANQVELQGIIQTSSKFHWIGVEGAVRPEKKKADDFEFDDEIPKDPFDKPSRWTGTDWMFRVIDDYEKDYPNLVKHAEDYPTPDYLRTITKVGNVGYEGEMDAPSDGSELIRKTILDDDERTLYIQVWGGCNTIARALLDIENEYKEQPEWKALHDKIMNKVVITACGEQDDTFREYIAEEWPGIVFVKTLQMQSYAYLWYVMPEGESKDTLKANYMKSEILNSKSALMKGYCTWLDGHEYEGEVGPAQFGSNPNIVNEWFGARFIKETPVKYDFLSEGDSPTYFCLLDWGFRTLENFGYGGLGGRYFKEDQKNSKGEMLNIWNVAKDNYTDRNGNVSEQESMWQYVADIQRDFAARVDWVSKDKYEEAEHMPILEIEEGLDFMVAPDEKMVLHANATTTDETSATVSFKVYEDASAACAKDMAITADGNMAKITVPADAKQGDLIHIIVKAQCDGKYRLTYYKQVILTVK